MTLDQIKKIAEPVCRKFEVQRLDVFGSLARGEGTLGSDVDLLVEFENPDLNLTRRFFGLLHSLEDTFDCKVDLLTASGLRNPYFRRKILESRVKIYGGR